MNRAFLAAIFAFLASASLANPNPPIFGSWYLPEDGLAACSTYFGLHIKPYALATMEAVCVFDDEARSGSSIVWHGRCNFSGEVVDPITVVATETRHSLAVNFGPAGTATGFKRCPVNN